MVDSKWVKFRHFDWFDEADVDVVAGDDWDDDDGDCDG